MTTDGMKVNALVPWFGSNRTNGACVGKLLDGCSWVGIPFGGGLCEVPHIQARTIVVSDLHRHVINLARVVADEEGRQWLAKEADALPFHPDVLAGMQEAAGRLHPFAHNTPADWQAALWYFVSQWMGRSGKAGTDAEFTGKLPVRWNSGGGDSNVRYRSAIASLDAWGQAMRGCNFVCLDVFEFLDSCKDEVGVGLYCDPPFPGPGDAYREKFGEHQQRLLASRLRAFEKALVVCRFYDHPLVRELYPETSWVWNFVDGRDQANQTKNEVYLVRCGMTKSERQEERPEIAGWLFR